VGVVVVGVVVVVVVAQEVFYVSPDILMSELRKSGSVCIHNQHLDDVLRRLGNSDARRKEVNPQISLTPWRRVLLQKLTVPQLVKKFLASYGPRRFIAMFTTAYTWSLTSSKRTLSTPAIPLIKNNCHIRIIFPYKPSSSEWSVAFRFTHQDPVRISLLPHAFHMPAHLPSYGGTNVW
jgi:hypothetical protein